MVASSKKSGGFQESLTYAQAAALLDCHVSNIPKYIRRGLLTSHGGRGTKGGSLDRREVEALAERRREEAAARERRRQEKSVDPRPDTMHDWLTVAEAAEVIGLTPDAVRKRAGKGKLPHVVHRGKVWVRWEHAELAANVRAARLTRKIRRTAP